MLALRYFTSEKSDLPHVVTAGARVLHQPAREVYPGEIGSARIEKVIDDLVKVMRKKFLVSLSAPQIGVPLRDQKLYTALSPDKVNEERDRRPFDLLQYGHVVDSFIPVRRSKVGKRFGMRWIALTAKQTQGQGERQAQPNAEAISQSTLVLDESCVNEKDYSLCLNGKVKEFGSLDNLKMVLCNEGSVMLTNQILGWDVGDDSMAVRLLHQGGGRVNVMIVCLKQMVTGEVYSSAKAKEDKVEWMLLKQGSSCKSQFKARFEQPSHERPIINMEFPNQLNSFQVADLEAEVSIEEIKKAVWDCGTDKAPGPDGFTFGFYKRYWGLIENLIVEGRLRMIVGVDGSHECSEPRGALVLGEWNLQYCFSFIEWWKGAFVPRKRLEMEKAVLFGIESGLAKFRLEI
ncbi:RNA-directed DNA polymerase, eukaryota, reverse transcriptase zinc-binding domain protein [Tanacetum coccineum]